MRIDLALAGAAALLVLAGCDPTEKHDYSCTGNFGSGPAATSACTQVHITEVEGNVAERACQDKGGVWHYSPCDATNRVPGYCLVPSAADYSLSGTPAKVFFYSPVTEQDARDACNSLADSDGTSWVDAASN